LNLNVCGLRSVSEAEPKSKEGTMKRLKRAGGVPSAAEWEIQGMLTPLVEALTDPDGDRRWDNVRRFLAECTSPPLLARLAARLVELLGSRKASTRRRAAASLAQIGSSAVPALSLALLKGRNATLKRAAAGVLMLLAPRLPLRQLLDLSYDVPITASLTNDASVRAALATLEAVVRQALEAHAEAAAAGLG